MARVLGSDARPERAGDSHRDRRRAARRLRRRVRRRPGRHRARPVSRARRPDREGSPARGRGAAWRSRRSRFARRALDQFLEGLTPPTPCCHGTPATRRSTGSCRGWVDAGLGRARRRAGGSACTSTSGKATALVLELWLQAEDDPTLGLPASLLWSGDDDVFAFLRDGDPRRDLIRQLTELDPVLAEIGIEFDAAEPDEAQLDPETVRLFLRNGLPLLEERGIPVLLPAAWVRSPARVKVNLTASSQPARRASGFLSPTELAPVRLAARSGRRRPHRRRARGARGREGAVHPRRRQVACAPPLGRRAGASLSRPPPRRRRDRRSRPRRLGSRDRRGGRRARRGHARRAARLAPRGRRAAVPLAARHRPRCSSSSFRSRSGATAGCGCSATSGSARSSPTTWASARRCRRSR